VDKSVIFHFIKWNGLHPHTIYTLLEYHIQSKSVIMSSKGPNKLCYTRVSLYARCIEKVKKNYFESKYRPAGMLLTLNDIINLKFKLQLIFRYNKCYFSIFVNFCTGIV